jgi:hypothetical protein
MRKIKKIDPLSVMKIAAICYGVVGLIEGALFSVIFAIAPLADHGTGNIPRIVSLFFGTFAIIFFPIFAALLGAITGGLGAVVYNVSARFVGGIQVDVE